MIDVIVEDPRTGRHHRLSRDHAVAMLTAPPPRMGRRSQRVLQGLGWASALGAVGAAVWAVGWGALAGVAAGLCLAWAWRTR